MRTLPLIDHVLTPDSDLWDVADAIRSLVRSYARPARDEASTHRGVYVEQYHTLDGLTFRLDVTDAPEDFDWTRPGEVEIERGVAGIEIIVSHVGTEKVNGRTIETYVVEAI